MARKTHEDALGITGAETTIGTGVNIKGSLISEADIAIDGSLVGTIKATGDVTIGVNAQIQGPIEATNIIIAGNVKGDIRATGETTIRETGRVEGDIIAAGLAITSGGIFAGRSIVEEQPPLLPQIDNEDELESTNSPKA